MAPEIYDENYGPGCDIYSFGMSVLEMATQKTPYHECQNVPQIYKKVISGQKPMDLDLIEDQELHDFISICLLSESERPTAEELQNHPFLITESANDNQPVSLQKSLMAQIEEEKPSQIYSTQQRIDNSQFQSSKNQSLMKNNERQDTQKIAIQNYEETKSQQQQQQPQEVAQQQQNQQINYSQLDQNENHQQLQQQQQSQENEIKSEQREKSTLSKATQNSENETLLHLNKIVIQNQHLIEKNSPTQQHSDTSEHYFNSSMETFESFYNQYLTTYYDYLQNESEEQMEYRHKIESIMLKKLHILQKESQLKQSQLSMHSGRMIQIIQEYLPSNINENQQQQQEQFALNQTKQQDSDQEQVQVQEGSKIQQSKEINQEQPVKEQQSGISKVQKEEPKQLVQQTTLEIQKLPLENQSIQNVKKVDSKAQSPVMKKFSQNQNIQNLKSQNESQIQNKEFLIESGSTEEQKAGSSKQHQSISLQKQVSILQEPKQKELQISPKEKASNELEQLPKLIKTTNSIIIDENPQKAIKSNQQLLEMLKAYNFSQALSMESKQIEDIKMLQLCLNELLPDDVVDNGHFGHYTQKLVKQVQKLNGEKEDGIVDQKMWDKIQVKVVNKLTKPIAEIKNVKQQENENKLQKLRNEQNKLSKIALDLLETEMINNLHLK